jgi:predicted permease
MSSISSTFEASIKSVGTACTMAAVGVYAHQRGLISAPGKKTLALLSQQVTFPLFLFTKIIYCNQDWSPEHCPDVTSTLEHGWMLLVWPLYVVSAGLLVGHAMAHCSGTPLAQRKAVWAAVAFGNSTGLPITLLSVVHANFPATSDLGRIDPTLFLSVYLLLYPVLQWGMGGWLLAPTKQVDGTSPLSSRTATDSQRTTTTTSRADVVDTVTSSRGDSLRNVLNHPQTSGYFSHRRFSSNDEGLYLSEVNLARHYEEKVENEPTTEPLASIPSGQTRTMGWDDTTRDAPFVTEDQPLLQSSRSETAATAPPSQPSTFVSSVRSAPADIFPADTGASYQDNVWHTIQNVADRCLQPPVVGALLGITFAVIPAIRGIWVDLIDRGSHAPLEWIFDGLYSIGLAAVPVNMLILGCNLSNSWNQYTGKVEQQANRDGLFSNRTLVAIVLGKMVILPFVGILSAVFLREFVLDVPDDMVGSFYLTLMIVFLTPTANNVMVMVELSGSNAKEGIASVIALQYATAPLILSLTMSVAIGVASRWS